MSSLLLKAFAYATSWSWQRFEKALQRPRQSQMKTLKAVVQAAGSPDLKDYAQFKQLPLCRYEDLMERIHRARQEGKNFLSQKAPLFYEPTSGSSGPCKLIPYTTALLHSFTHLFILWAHDILCYGPPLKGGKIYFSISPQFHATGEGLDDDSAYLVGPIRQLFQLFTVVPPQIKALRNPRDFYHILALYLLAAPDLEVLSVWSPEFLLALLHEIRQQRHILAHAGQYSKHQVQGLCFETGKIPTQARAALCKGDEIHWADLFPGLRLISCWAGQNAAVGYRRLKALFPWVHIQAKGLLATEAPISFPSEKYGQFLPLLDEVFLEFMSPEGHIYLLDEIQTGQEYELIISQKAGFLRYRLGDYIRVTGQVGATPCFEFIGRAENVSDLVGEKLHEALLQQLIQALWPDTWVCLIPDKMKNRYILCSDQPVDGALLEEKLMANPHYHNARQLKQLKPLQSLYIPDLPERIKSFFCCQRGLKWGDIKDHILYSRESDGELLAFLTGESPSD